MSRILRLGITGSGPDPQPVELEDGTGLIVNAGRFRVVFHAPDVPTDPISMHVIEDGEGETVFEWPQ